jgi:peptide/nickel transport system permease protein
VLLVLVIVASARPGSRPMRRPRRTPTTCWRARARPSARHRRLGRDIFSRLVYGAPATVYASLLAVGVAILIGPAGRARRRLLRRLDRRHHQPRHRHFLSFPAIVLAIAVTGALGIGLTNGMIAVGIVMFPALARIVRARTLIVRQELYVDASRCFGAPAWHILWKHVLPNALQPVIVQVTLLLAAALLAEASLSFLGLGIQPPTRAGAPCWPAPTSIWRSRRSRCTRRACHSWLCPWHSMRLANPCDRARSDHERPLIGVSSCLSIDC